MVGMRILIVGAGVAGPTVAHWLLQGNHEVTIVERASAPREGGYLIDFWGAGFDVAVTARTVHDGEEREHSPTVHGSDTSPLPGSLDDFVALVIPEL